MKSIIRFFTWLHYGRHYQTDLRPFRLLWIDPDRISRYPRQKPSIVRWAASGVVDGDWDRDLNRFENGVVFRSFRLRFVEEQEWKDTQYHRFSLERIDSTGSYKGATTGGELEQRYERLDKLYRDISENGYRAQRELDADEGAGIHRHLHLPPEMREVTVDLSRTGEFLWWGGAHRLAIAKLLGLGEIPVRIRVRHENWQRRRDRILGEGDSPEHHPDLPL